MIEAAPLSGQGLPTQGRHLLASFDDERAVVWQAHAPDVASQALADGRFGGPGWRGDPLPSLLERCGWGTRLGRERILAVFLTRDGLDAILRQAVHAEFEAAVYASMASWRLATRWSPVSIAWYRDRDATGGELERETPRLGLRDAALSRFTDTWVVGVEDWTERLRQGRPLGRDLPLPVVRPYPLPAPDLDRLVGRGDVR